ncbi:Arc family DNA-binding protein [Oceanospirillaceae bacterium ASx5O]|nr:Arc family DNA-binding protein [Oceanospirillaceae bacterium ASx5O]
MPKKSETTQSKTSHIAPFGLRMQPVLRAQLENSARASGRSMNAEIVHRLERSFAEDSGAANEDLETIGQALDGMKEELSDLKILYEIRDLLLKSSFTVKSDE